jgi:hypothetical protein
MKYLSVININFATVRTICTHVQYEVATGERAVERQFRNLDR